MKVKLLPNSDDHSGPRFIFDSGGYHGGNGISIYVENEELHCVVAIMSGMWTVGISISTVPLYIHLLNSE